MIRILLALAVSVPLAACGTTSPLGQLPSDDTVSAHVEKDITSACVMSGLFKLANSVALSAVPVGGLPASVINAGIDRVCADPARYARDTGVVAWLITNLPRQ